MNSNPIDGVALLNTIFVQNKKILQLYPNSIALFLKSRLLQISSTNDDLKNVIKSFDKCSEKHCMLDINQSYFAPIELGRNIENVNALGFIFYLKNWPYSIVFTDRINLIEIITGTILDSLELSDFNRWSDFRIYFQTISNLDKNRIRINSLTGFIIQFDQHDIDFLTFDGDKRRIMSSEKDIVQLNLLSSKHILVRTGKCNEDVRSREYQDYQIIDIKNNGKVIQKFSSDTRWISLNLSDFEIYVEDNNRKLYMIVFSDGGAIQLFEYLINCNDFCLNPIFTIPYPGLQTTVPNICIDRLFYYENRSSRHLKGNYEKYILRFAVYHAAKTLCIFEVYVENDADKSIRYRVEALEYKHDRVKLNMLAFYGNLISFGNWVYQINENKVVNLDFGETIYRAVFLSEETLAVCFALKFEVKIFKIINNKHQNKLVFLELFSVNNAVLDPQFCKVFENGIVIYHDYFKRCIKMVNIYNTLLGSTFDLKSTNSVNHRNYDLRTYPIYPIKDDKILIKLIDQHNSIGVFDVSTKETTETINENEVKYFVYSNEILLVYTSKSIAVYKDMGKGVFKILDCIKTKNEIIKRKYDTILNYRKEEIVFLTSVNDNNRTYIDLYRFSLSNVNDASGNKVVRFGSIKTRSTLSDDDSLCLAEDYLLIVSNAECTVKYIDLLTQEIVLERRYHEMSLTKPLTSIKPVEGENNIIFTQKNETNSKENEIYYMVFDKIQKDVNLIKLFLGPLIEINIFDLFFLHSYSLFISSALSKTMALGLIDLKSVTTSDSRQSVNVFKKTYILPLKSCCINPSNTIFMASCYYDLRLFHYSDGEIGDLILKTAINVTGLRSFITETYLCLIDTDEIFYTYFIRGKFKGQSKILVNQKSDLTLNAIIKTINPKSRSNDIIDISQLDPFKMSSDFGISTNVILTNILKILYQNATVLELIDANKKKVFHSPLDNNWLY